MEGTIETVGFEARLKELGLGEGWTWDKGSWWLAPTEPIDVRATAEHLMKLDARFVAITAMERPDKEIRLDYQWDLDGKLLSFVTVTAHKQITTIADLVPGADWAERETYEYFAVEFKGRMRIEPLMTRPGDPVGINLRKEAVQ
jgi:NADH:ubiquinone oxidoreductase subunit C